MILLKMFCKLVLWHRLFWNFFAILSNGFIKQHLKNKLAFSSKKLAINTYVIKMYWLKYLVQTFDEMNLLSYLSANFLMSRTIMFSAWNTAQNNSVLSALINSIQPSEKQRQCELIKRTNELAFRSFWGWALFSLHWRMFKVKSCRQRWSSKLQWS